MPQFERIPNPKNPLFDLTAQLKGRKNIRIFGVRHGKGNALMPPHYYNYLESALTKMAKRNPTLVLAEGSANAANRAQRYNPFLPEQFHDKAECISSPLVQLLSFKAFIKTLPDLKLEEVKRYDAEISSIQNDAPKIFRKPKSRKTEIKENKLKPFALKSPAWRFLKNVRSALMAAEILKKSRENPEKHIGVSMGADHASLAYNFIKKPMHAITYLSNIRETLEEAAQKPSFGDPFSNIEILSFDAQIQDALQHIPVRRLLEDAQKEFAKLLPEKKIEELRKKRYLLY